MAMYDDCIVRLLDLPCSVKAVTALDEDGCANIYINSKLSREEQQKAARHELAHVSRDDFHSDTDIHTCEEAAEVQ
jgi:hypothetical protein